MVNPASDRVYVFSQRSARIVSGIVVTFARPRTESAHAGGGVYAIAEGNPRAA
ncbi:hypothetical protein [Ferviditalea candida]|uniref:Uncharacterized protein n=1 Tax=Ferviditalea candida TaxID=3108399 RepID=A0ABU5ZH90_9BACL|nr:hypothetical protein [Paenibacillaceae bacterium T2]